MAKAAGSGAQRTARLARSSTEARLDAGVVAKPKNVTGRLALLRPKLRADIPVMAPALLLILALLVVLAAVVAASLGT
jgi:hypothetical protein